MAADRDAQIGLHASVHSSRDEVIAACTRAASLLGKHASVSVASAKVTVKIFPGLVQAMSSVSPLVGITLKPGDADDAIVVDAKIERYRTLQSQFLFIPIGPKQLSGKSSYLNLLKALEQELVAIDKGGGSVRRTGVAV